MMIHVKCLVRAFSTACLLLAAAGGVSWAEPRASAPTTALRQDLIVRQIAPGVWQHVAFKPSPDGGRIPANGLLVTTGKISLMIDTGWNPNQARRLLDWAETTLGQPVEHVILTHAHEDRIGGLAAVRERPIIVHGHATTSRLIQRAGGEALDWSFEFQERVELGGETVELFYPGPGHAPDNIVVWLPRHKLLFAGCLVKAAPAASLGHIADADIGAWPLAIRRLIERFRDAEIVVPGHGKPGGPELLSFTMELLEQATADAPGR